MKVRLKNTHVHAGKIHQAGEAIDLDEDAAQWLIEIGHADSAQQKKEPKKSTPGE